MNSRERTTWDSNVSKDIQQKVVVENHDHLPNEFDSMDCRMGTKTDSKKLNTTSRNKGQEVVEKHDY